MTGKTVYIVMRCEWGEGGYPVEVHISKEKAEQLVVNPGRDER